ncbi:MAG: hypothetical protein M0Z39_01485 [Actinomycetota bacterium]|nr:hypothetical protein [Actinomycetota bacterium]
MTVGIRMRSWRVILALLPLFLIFSACGHSSLAVTAAPTTSPTSWVDQHVSFVAGGIRIYATLRHPTDSSQKVPGVLLIAGSGPTDRNGNSSLTPGSIDTLKTIADWLSEDGVASLRYDKLGSGHTGLGRYASDPATIGLAPFEQESLAALGFLARQANINDNRLGVFGHSEGALFSLLLASGTDGPTPPVRALGLIEPLSVRYLDLVKAQVDMQIGEEVQAGYFTSSQASQARATLAAAVTHLRSTGKVPTSLPFGLSNVLSPSTALFFYQADQYDPASLAAKLLPGTAVFVSCSNADQQVSCAEVNHLVSGLEKAKTSVDFVHLVGVDHVLKVDPTGSTAGFTKPLPFSPQFKSALAAFVQRKLD